MSRRRRKRSRTGPFAVARTGPGLGGVLIARLKQLGMVFCAVCYAYLPPGHDCGAQQPAPREVNPHGLV